MSDPLAGFAGHPFLRGMRGDDVARLADVAVAVLVPAGHRFFSEGGRAGTFWLVTDGHVALDLRAPGRPNLIVETLGGGDLLGLSWLSAPYQWQFGAEAVEPTAAFELDGVAVRTQCDAHPEFGYQVIRRVTAVAARRLHGARIRMLDLYAAPARSAGTR